MDSTSPRFHINGIDFYKTARSTGIVVLSYAAMAIIAQVINDLSNGTIELGDFAMFQGVMISGLSFFMELLRRYVTDYSR